MAVNQPAPLYSLPCGREVETVWERLDEVEAGRADTHELDCPHCASARQSLVVLRTVTGDLVAETAEPSASLAGRIMSAVRAEVHRREMLPLPTAEPGGAQISEQAVAAVLRFAADTVDGVRARHCRVSRAESPDDAVEVEVELSVAVSYRGFERHALDEVLARVSAAADARVGLRLARLDVVIEDIYDA